MILNKVLTAVIVLFYALPRRGYAQNWNYNQQDQWGGFCNTGKSQSPINIQTSSVIRQNNLPGLTFTGFNQPVTASVINNGHTVLVTISNGTKPQLSGAGLIGSYHFENLHFHWPAEHTVNGQYYDLEAHLVFYSNKFPNISTALKNKNGVTVLGVFYNRMTLKGQAIFDKLASSAETISKNVGSKTTASGLVFQELLPDDKSYFNYIGSLTTPNCNEGVNWLILRTVGKINADRYKSLTTIYGPGNQLLKFTNRKIQQLNGRKVYSNV